MTVLLSVSARGARQMTEAASNPSTACRGQEVEMVTPGGEVAFVGRMVADSLQLREQIRWYTSMVSASRYHRPRGAQARCLAGSVARRGLGCSSTACANGMCHSQALGACAAAARAQEQLTRPAEQATTGRHRERADGRVLPSEGVPAYLPACLPACLPA
eukprot:COSAG02_NODE_5410_length_4351_cov_5.357479_4_plen_160_part_00